VIKKFLVLFSFFIFGFSISVLGQNSLSGVVLDAETGETIIGCNILLQGTTLGSVTDFDGKFELKNIPSGDYNIIISFISYDKHIEKVTVTKVSRQILNVKLRTSTNQIKYIVVTAQRRTDSELTMLTATRSSLTIANGISSQQIMRSQDKDASEVIRRIPGVTIREGKFVIVRGLTERYNSVWLNGTSTPSSESDVRAFSFDVIPSGQIDNILIYKTPAPELPADFAGAMINVKTKSLIDRNSVSVSASVGYNQLSTGKVFYSSPGSKTDWLGYDNTVRVIPSIVPATEDYKKLFNQVDADKKKQINDISKAFNTNLAPAISTAKPDADVSLAFNQRFRLGNISVGTITALGYSSSTSAETAFRAAYLAYPDTSFRYLQSTFQSKVRLTALSNWTFTFGDNQRIEFRNLFNNMGSNRTVLKEGFDVNRQLDRSYELGYESRLTFSSQSAGTHSFNAEATKLDWVVGYAYANKNQPDIRRIKTVAADNEPDTQYFMDFSTQGAPEAFGRLFLRNNEDNLSAGVNFSQKFKLDIFQPELKAGVYYESKQRDFTNRVFNYAKSGRSNFYYTDINSYNNVSGFDEAMFNSVVDIAASHLDYDTGLLIRDASQKADAYNASNKLMAGYLAFNLPVTRWFNMYAGLRIEQNRLALNGYKRDGTDNNPLNVNIDTLNIYPSINTTINLNEKMMFRLAGGKTVNRPEFREVSPFAFYNFEENATTYGNPEVRNSYISNVDARYEWYPTSEEIISLGVFYKYFNDPIESKILYTGSGWNYTYHNAEEAKSYGIEFDARKRLHEFDKADGLKFLSNISLVVNASLIKSVIKTDSITEGESQRVLQGQSPYIVNVGLYYNDIKHGIMGSAMFNKAGKRIAVVGDINIPHIYEMPFNSLDFTFEKKLFEKLSIKFGIKNALDSDVVFQQFQKYTTPTNESTIREQVTNKYKPGRQFKLGVSLTI
jgi:TonB-dependent receptor